MPLFIVVDENNQWLHYGTHRYVEEAAREAKNASDYDSEAEMTVFVVEDGEEHKFSPQRLKEI